MSEVQAFDTAGPDEAFLADYAELTGAAPIEAAKPEPAKVEADDNDEELPEAAEATSGSDEAESEEPTDGEQVKVDLQAIIAENPDAVIEVDGEQIKVKDALWRNKKYMQAMTSLDKDRKAFEAERGEYVKAERTLRDLDARLKGDGLGFVLDAAAQVDPGLAEVVRDYVARKNYNPAEYQAKQLEAERAELSAQKQQQQYVQQAQSELMALEGSLGRELTDKEFASTKKVYESYLAALRIDPSTPRPSLQECYDEAMRGLRYLEPKAKTKKPTTERARNVATRSTGPSEQDDIRALAAQYGWGR